MARVWPDRIVEENALQVQMSALRAALGAGARADPHGLRTRLPVHGRNPSAAGGRRCSLTIARTDRGGDSDRPRPRPTCRQPVSELIGRDDALREIVGTCRLASARHADRPRRHRQDAACLCSRARTAAALPRRRLGC